MKTLIKNATIINENRKFLGSVFIINDTIESILEAPADIENIDADTIINADGLILIPGVIDDQVHFREPGMTQKADIHSESRAALAGGVTSFMDMPNNIPPATTIDLLEKKYDIASHNSAINYSFYFGATNNNIDEIKKVNPQNVCGVKVFMGSSTGNMLVDNIDSLKKIFELSPTLIATHCEDENTIRNNLDEYKKKFGENIPFECHCMIRSSEACAKSTALAMELAKTYNSRLHILHISTAKEVEMLKNVDKSRITAETCIHYLWFCDHDYATMKGKIKCNPSIKTDADRSAIRMAVSEGIIDILATDHAPHMEEEKNKDYLHCPSGLPLVQHSLNIMLELVAQNIFKIETVVERMCHTPAKIFGIKNRGYIRKGYKADIVLIDPKSAWVVEKSNILYKCKWSPFEGYKFNSQIKYTFVNGHLAYNNGKIDDTCRGERIEFDRN